MAVAMELEAMPGAQVGSHRGELAHQRLLDREAIQRLLARGAVDAQAGFLHHPAAGLLVQIREIAERAGGKEITLDVLDAGLDHALLGRVRRRTRIDLETISFGALGIRALDQRIARTGAGDRALGVVDNHPSRDPSEPLEGAPVTAEPGHHTLIEDELDVLVTREAQRITKHQVRRIAPRAGSKRKGPA